MEGTNFSAALGRAWESVIMFLPLFLAFLVILVIGYAVAALLGKAVDKLLTKAGFDRAVERGGIKRAMSRSGVHMSTLIGKVVFYTVFLVALQMAFGVFGPNPISLLLTDLIAFLPRIFVALAIFVVAAYVGQMVKDVVVSALGNLSYGRMLASVAGMSVVVIGVFAALDHLGVARNIVVGLFYAMLAIVVGVSIVAIGGGGIEPMRRRWERALSIADAEAPRVVEAARADRRQAATAELGENETTGARIYGEDGKPIEGNREEGGYLG
jgi:hypothetical protein